jgi:hypothetical protein
VTMSWDHERYFAKFKVYWDQSTRCSRDSDQFLANVAFACEFMIRGALCKKNPALNAALESESLLFAVGVTSRKPPVTISISEAIKRLQRLVPQLSDDTVAKLDALLSARNRELHGDLSEFSQLTHAEIMPSIYLAIVEILKFWQQDIKSALGEDDARQAEAVATAVSKDRKKRVADLVRISKERFFSLDQPNQAEKRKVGNPTFISAVLKGGQHVIAQKCPSCSSQGLIAALPVGSSAPILRGQTIIQEVRVIPSQFECKICELVIKGLDELMSAGFAHEYTSIDELDPVEHLEINPIDYIDVEDVARSYHEGMYEYQDE